MTSEETFRLKPSVRWVLVIGALLGALAIPGAPDATGTLVGAGLFCMLAVAAVDAQLRRFLVDARGVEKRTLAGTRRIDFGDLGRASVEREVGGRSIAMVTIRLYPRGRDVFGGIVVRTMWWERRHVMIELIRTVSP